MTFSNIGAGFVCVLISACSSVPLATPADFNPAAAHVFFANMQSICGGTFPGRVVSTQEVDAEWRASDLVLGPVACEGELVTLPLRVGEDTSRTWFLRRNPYGLTFHHRHLLADGTPDPVSNYGGAIAETGTPFRQAFPADEGSKIMFRENDLDNSVHNRWILTLAPGETLTYALSRPAEIDGRDFRAEFDISEPIAP